MTDLTLQRLDRLPRWPWSPWLLVNLGGSFFFAFYDVVIAGSALPVIGQQFDKSASTMGYVITINVIGLILGEFAGAWLAIRASRRTTLLIALWVFSLGMVISALAPSFWVLMAGRFIAGLGTGADIAVLVTYVAEISPSRMRGRITGFTTICGYVGIAIAPFLSTWLLPMGDWGWRVLFGFGAVGAIVIVLTRQHMPSSPRLLMLKGRQEQAEALVAAAEKRVEAKYGPLPPVVEPPVEVSAKHWRPWVLMIFSVAWIFYYFGNYGWLAVAPTILTQNGFSLESSLGFIAIANLGLVLGAVASYLVSDRVERKWLLAATLGVWTIALAAIALTGSGSAIAVLGFLAAFTIGLGVPVFYAFTAEHVPARIRPLGMASTDGLGHIGGALAPIVLIGMSMGVAFGWMAASGAVAFALMLVIPAVRGRSIEQVSG